MPSHTSFFLLSSDERWTLYRKQLHPYPIYKFIVRFPNEHIFLFGIYIDEKLVELQKESGMDTTESTSGPLPKLSLVQYFTDNFKPNKRKQCHLTLNTPVAEFAFGNERITLTSELHGEIKEWNTNYDTISNNGTKQNRAWYLIIDGASYRKMGFENKDIIEKWDYELVGRPQ